MYLMCVFMMAKFGEYEKNRYLETMELVSKSIRKG